MCEYPHDVEDGIDLTRMECKAPWNRRYTQQKPCIDLTRMECKDEQGEVCSGRVP